MKNTNLFFCFVCLLWSVFLLKGNLYSYTRFTLNFWKYSLKSNFFREQGNNNLVFQEFRYEYRLFLLLNFPRAVILDFMASFGCCYCHKAEDILCVTIEQPCDGIKSKMVASGKRKSENRG